MTAIRRKFDLYLEPSYEVFEFRLVDETGKVLGYLNRIKGTNETKWLPNDEETFKLKTNNRTSDVYKEAKRALINLSNSNYKDIKDLIKTSNYTLTKISIEAYSIPRKETYLNIELDL